MSSKIICTKNFLHLLVEILERLGPKGADVYPQHFRRVDGLSQTPKQCTFVIIDMKN
jgi:hypothetical protein